MPYVFTPEGLKRLEVEYNGLKEKWANAAQQVAIAKELGDTSDSAEYRTAQELWRNTKKELEDNDAARKDAMVVDIEHVPVRNRAEFGTYVYLLPLDTSSGRTPKLHRIVSESESQNDIGYLSYTSPVCQRFLNKPVLSKIVYNVDIKGEDLEVEDNYDYEIAAVFYDPSRFAKREIAILAKKDLYDYQGPSIYAYKTKNEIIAEVQKKPGEIHLVKTIQNGSVVWANAVDVFEELKDKSAKEKAVKVQVVLTAEEKEALNKEQIEYAEKLVRYLMLGERGRCLTEATRQNFNFYLREHRCTLSQVRSVLDTAYAKYLNEPQFFDQDRQRIFQKIQATNRALNDLKEAELVRAPDDDQVAEIANQLMQTFVIIYPKQPMISISADLQDTELSNRLTRLLAAVDKTQQETPRNTHPKYQELQTLYLEVLDAQNSVARFIKAQEVLVAISRFVNEQVDFIRTRHPQFALPALPMNLEQKAEYVRQAFVAALNELNSQLCKKEDIEAFLQTYVIAEQMVAYLVTTFNKLPVSPDVDLAKELAKKAKRKVKTAFNQNLCRPDQVMTLIPLYSPLQTVPVQALLQRFIQSLN